MDESVLNTNITKVQNAALSVDASYTFERTEKGVYLLVTDAQGAGAPLTPDFVICDLYRRGISGLNLPVILSRLKKGEKIIRLADAQDEIPADADVAVKISPDEMTATMMLFAPVADGKQISPDAVLDLLRNKWHISYGLDEAAVISLVSAEEYDKPLVFAKGREPVKGDDGKLNILFKIEHNHAPQITEDGSADYKNLDIFESTTENDILAEIIPPEEGIDGLTVTGKPVPAPKGKPAKLPKGKNTKISEDGSKLFATKSGRVDYTAGLIEVSDVLRIAGDVDMGTGNIDFSGDVEIKGNVISGLTVNATGSIEILGAVEASSIIAGKNIVLKNGIQGMDKGMLQAGGNITVRFIEKSIANAKGNIYSDYIAHSTVNAIGSVIMSGKFGKIVGSVVRSGKEVVARYIGANSVIEIGVSPEMRGKLVDLEKNYDEDRVQIDKIDSITGAMPTDTIGLETNTLYQKLIKAKEQLEQDYIQCAEEITMLRTVLAKKSGGKIHVTSSICQDVRLIIDSLQYIVESSMEYVTFKYKDGDIVFGPCEKTIR